MGNAIQKSMGVVQLRRIFQFKFICSGLIIIMLCVLYFSAKRMQDLETAIYLAGSRLTGVYDLQPVLYIFENVKENPTVENVDALFRELSFRKQAIEALISLHKNEINPAVWQEYERIRNSEQTTAYFLRKPHEIDIDIIEEIETTWMNHDFIKNDINREGIINPSSFTGSYIDLLKALEKISLN